MNKKNVIKAMNLTVGISMIIVAAILFVTGKSLNLNVLSVGTTGTLAIVALNEAGRD